MAKVVLEIEIDWMTNHFGKNPRNGGRPPRDSRLENRKNFSFGFKFMVKIWIIWKEDSLESKEIIAEFTSVYTVM